MIKVKVLQLQFPYNSDIKIREKLIWKECLYKKTQIRPIFNRVGWYYDRINRVSWIELKDGSAYQDDKPDDFLFNLEQFNHKPLSIIEQKAIKILSNRNICLKSLRKLSYIDFVWKESRYVKQSVQLFRIRTIGR